MWTRFHATAFGLAALFVGCGNRGVNSSSGPPGHSGSQTQPVTASPHAHGRLVVLGFDGVDPRFLERFAAEGKLPNLSALMHAPAGSGYRHLTSTNPPQSPVAWATFATGTPPGDHGIFDFIARSLRSHTGAPTPPLPKVATTEFSIPAMGPPVARNLRTGEPFWKTLADHGVRAVVLNVPYTFPADPMRDGRMLSGLGTPDVRGTNSTFTFVDSTAHAGDSQPGGGQIIPVTVANDAAAFALDGPSIEGRSAPASLQVRVAITGDDAMSVTLGGQAHTLHVGEPSDFVDVSFDAGGRAIRGVLKMLAVEARPALKLFITPISFDPRAPFAPLAYPRGFSAQVAQDVGGPFKTVGWDHDTSALTAEVIDDGAFLRDVDAIEAQRRAMLLARLSHDDWDTLVWVSTAPDRVSHMFYRLIDPDHPRYDAALAHDHGDAIEHEYRRMDDTVGRVLRALHPNDTLLILSDHGFHDFRRGLQVNQWLRREGLLTLRGGATSATHEFLLDVDWAHTKVYALGTGQLYVNMQGREASGIVPAADAPGLLLDVRRRLLALTDAERAGVHPVHEVYLGADIFRGGRSADAPDAQIAFAENYRTSWETILGGCPAELFTDNTKKWSGDHAASDVSETPGVLLSNRPIANEHPGIIDLAPTALAFFGQPIPPRYQGHALLGASR